MLWQSAARPELGEAQGDAAPGRKGVTYQYRMLWEEEDIGWDVGSMSDLMASLGPNLAKSLMKKTSSDSPSGFHEHTCAPCFLSVSVLVLDCVWVWVYGEMQGAARSVNDEAKLSLRHGW